MEDLSKVRVKGGFYNDSADLVLRESIDHRVSVIYGVNGSGKSSLANAIDEYKDGSDCAKTYDYIDFLDCNNKICSLTDQEKSNIWVYSERYQDSNINWDEDNLGAIVMFGEQGEIDTKLRLIKSDIEKLKGTQEAIKVERFSESKGEFSISSIRKQMIDVLKSSWALREKDIKKLSRNASVKEYLVDEIMDNFKPTQNIIDLKKDYGKQIKDFLSIDDSGENLEQFDIPDFDLNKICEVRDLLELKLIKSEGSPIEEKLYSLINSGQTSIVNSSYDHFTHNNSIECPYCMQIVPEQHKQLLIQSIRNVLNEEVQNHIDELQNYKIPMIQIELNYLRKLNDKIVTETNALVLKCNGNIVVINKIIDDKINNPYVPILVDTDDLINSVGLLNNNLKKLKNCIDEYNDKIKNIKNFEFKLQELNKKISYCELISLHEKFNRLQLQETDEKRTLKNINIELSKLETKVSELNAEKGQVDIALKDINTNLFKIFAGKNRLRLELDENSNYRVISRNKSIKLKKLSTGEKNVISLCYFFAQLRNNTNAYDIFSDSYFIVLDDPISSLDFENKVGIYTFLRSQLENILVNNMESRIIVLTHDLEVAYKLDKVFNDIKESTSLSNFFCCRRFEIDKNTVKVDLKKANTYGWNLELIYKYANEDKEILENADLYIGNVLRKTLEAYSTFNYRLSISQLTQRDNILQKIKSDSLREYYKSRMYRLVLNSDSHTNESAKIFMDHELFEEFDRSERVAVARDIICILFLLDEEHIKSYLPNNAKIISNIKEWINMNNTGDKVFD